MVLDTDTLRETGDMDIGMGAPAGVTAVVEAAARGLMTAATDRRHICVASCNAQLGHHSYGAATSGSLLRGSGYHSNSGMYGNGAYDRGLYSGNELDFRHGYGSRDLGMGMGLGSGLRTRGGYNMSSSSMDYRPSHRRGLAGSLGNMSAFDDNGFMENRIVDEIDD
jgi:hypothetical protein